MSGKREGRVILPEQWNHEVLARVSKELGVPLKRLVALKTDNDPYLAGRPARREKAEWFAAQHAAWRTRFPGQKAHQRGLHYHIASQEPPVLLPPIRSGPRKGLVRPYLNHEDCWNTLQLAAKDARYLGLVGLGELDDRRTPAARTYLSRRARAVMARAAGGLWGEVLLPWPHLVVDEYVAEQPVVGEIWIEKSTQDDILIPLCERYDVTLQVGVGQMGIEPVYEFILRVQADGRPHVIFYISDHDAQGEGMPVAVAIKIQWMRERVGDCPPVQLYPIALTKQQVIAYRLPPIPAEGKSPAQKLWDERHGGRVEVDALQALYPGVLPALVEDTITCFRDPTLPERVRAARQEALRVARAAEVQVMAEFAEERESCAEAVQEAWERACELSDRMEARLAEVQLELPPVPESLEVEGLDEEPLYDSARDYLTQNDFYQARKPRDWD